MLWTIIIILTIAVALWVTYIRPWLRHKPWMEWFFENPVVEWIEIHVYRKSEGIAWARYLTGLGTFLTAVSNIDPSTVAMLEQLLPEKYKVVARFIPLTLTGLGLVGERLRGDTTKMIEQVELPALVPVQVAEVIHKVDEAKRELKAVIETMPDIPADAPLVKVE